jgi:hypothetical protein
MSLPNKSRLKIDITRRESIVEEQIVAQSFIATVRLSFLLLLPPRKFNAIFLIS